jgi:hypothetical protein
MDEVMFPENVLVKFRGSFVMGRQEISDIFRIEISMRRTAGDCGAASNYS